MLAILLAFLILAGEVSNLALALCSQGVIHDVHHSRLRYSS